MAKKKTKKKAAPKIRLITFGGERKKIATASKKIKSGRENLVERRAHLMEDMRELAISTPKDTNKGRFIETGVKIKREQLERKEIEQKTAERELRQQKRDLTTKQIKEVKRFTKEAAKRIESMAAQKLKQRAVNKRVLKRSKATVVVKERELAPYIPIYFKEKVEKDNRQFFFK